MSQLFINKGLSSDMLAQLRDMQDQANAFGKATPQPTSGGQSFLDHLKEGVEQVNAMQKNADKMATEVASGKSEHLHETMLAVTEAELTFNLMVQVRNKALEAYQEVMRMPV